MVSNMTDIVERLRAYAEINEHTGAYTEANCAFDAIAEIERLRRALEDILLDIKFLTEDDILPDTMFSDIIYQRALKLMTDDFMKKFKGE